MALPAVMMAYKERDNALKLIVYAFVGIAVIYFLWKIFKAFEKLGKVDDAVKEVVNEVKQKVGEHITTSSEYHERIKKEKEEIPAKVEELAKKYNLSKKEKEELKESMLREAETKEQMPYFYAYHGGAVDYKKTLEKEREKQKRILEKKKEVKPTYKTIKEHMELEGKRWQARADYYKKQQAQEEQKKEQAIKEEIERFKRARAKKSIIARLRLINPPKPLPMKPKHILPVNPRERIFAV